MYAYRLRFVTKLVATHADAACCEGRAVEAMLLQGGRMAAGGNVVEEGKKLNTNVRPSACAWPCTFCRVRTYVGSSLIPANYSCDVCTVSLGTYCPFDTG